MKVTLIILQTLDSIIACELKDDLSWGSKEDKKFFSTKTKEIGTMVMGASTFRNMPEKAFTKRKSLVFTSDPDKYSGYENPYGEVDFIKGTPEEGLKRLEEQGIEEVALIGGGNINNQFLDARLVDEMYITIAPKIFGTGIRGVGEKELNIDLELLDVHKFADNEVLLHYKVKK